MQTQFLHNAALVGFDGNNRRYPTMLSRSLKNAGFKEQVLAKEGPDELRFFYHKSATLRLQSHRTLPGFEGMHHIQIVEFEYEDTNVGVIFFNSGRGSTAETSAALNRLADAAQKLNKTCDYVFVLVVEFGEGDKNKRFEFKTLSQLLDIDFKPYFGNRRECIFVSRGSGKKDSKYDVIRKTSVAHQSPTRGQALVVVEKLGLLVDAWHSQAGAYNGKRAQKIKQQLIDGWWRVFKRTDATVEKWLLKK